MPSLRLGSRIADLSKKYTTRGSSPHSRESTHFSRRSFLATTGVFLSGVSAGCTGNSGSSFSSQEVGAGRIPSDALDEYEYIHLRNSRAEPIITIDDTNRRSRLLLFSESDLDRIEFTENLNGSAEAKELLESTDFTTESVILHQRTVEECYLLHVEYVVARPDQYRIQFCQVLQDVDVACRANVSVMQATLIRIPVAYDDRPSSSGSGRRSTCHDPPAELPEIGVIQ